MQPTSQNNNPSAPHLIGGRPSFDSSVWIRLPAPRTRCPVSGLSRSSLSELCRPVSRNNWQPPVEAKVLKRRNANRGVLLINRASLLAFIEGQPAPVRADLGETPNDAAQ